MVVGVIGTGLIGGSIAIDLKRNGFADKVLGVEQNPLNAQVAKDLGIVDQVATLDECIVESDIIIVAIPVSGAVKLIPQILNRVTEKQIVTDVCSTKGMIASVVKYHPNRKQFVLGHPMSGTEYSGPRAAMSGLFDGRAGIICDAEESDMRALATVQKMYDALNMRLIHLSSAQHDVHTAYVSHVSHVISYALALTVLEREKNDRHIFDLAAGGFASTARLAKSSPEMWVPIFMQNRDNVLAVMDTYIEKIQAFRRAIDDMDEVAITKLIQGANRIKRIIR